jgi:hypothetical protein
MIVAIMFVTNILFTSANWARSHIEAYLKENMKYYANTLLHKKLASPGVESLEDPEITDEVERFKDNYPRFNSFMWNMQFLLSAMAYLTLNLFSLFRLLPWFVL